MKPEISCSTVQTDPYTPVNVTAGPNHIGTNYGMTVNWDHISSPSGLDEFYQIMLYNSTTNQTTFHLSSTKNTIIRSLSPGNYDVSVRACYDGSVEQDRCSSWESRSGAPLSIP